MPPKLKDKKVDHFFASIKKRRFIGSGEDVPFDHELKDLMERNDYSIY